MSHHAATRSPYLVNAAHSRREGHDRWAWEPGDGRYLEVSALDRTVTWSARPPAPVEPLSPSDRPAWVPIATRARLHSGRFRWDFLVEEMADAQIGIGFMLLWDVGVDWGFFGYLGASTTAWAYDLSTGDVVTDTRSIQSGLPTSGDRHTGVVEVVLDLPREGVGIAHFVVDGRTSNPIELTSGAVVVPAACLLAPTQRVTLSELRTWPETAPGR